MEELFGFKISSPQYKLYSYLIHKMEGLDQSYIAVAKDKSMAFFIEDDESFNDFILSLNLSIQDNKEIVNLAQAYLKIIPYWNFTREILWELPPWKEDKSWGSGTSFRMWFLKHIKYSFYPPKVKKIEGGYSVECYSCLGLPWQRLIAEMVNYPLFGCSEEAIQGWARRRKIPSIESPGRQAVSRVAKDSSTEEKKMLTCLYVYLRSFLASLRDEKGADLAEYALLLAFIAIAVIGAVAAIGQQIGPVFERIRLALYGGG